MHRVSEILGEVGGYRVSTPASIGEYQQAKLNEEVEWWWQLKRKIFEAAAPQTVFGTREPWSIDHDWLSEVTEDMCKPLYSGMPSTSDDDYDSDVNSDSNPPSPKRSKEEVQVCATRPLGFLTGSLCREVTLLRDIVVGTPADLTNDVGKQLFSALLTYALSTRLNQRDCRIVADSGFTVWLSTTNKEDQRCFLSASALFSDGVEETFKAVADLKVVRSSAKTWTRVIGEIKSQADRSKGQG